MLRHCQNSVNITKGAIYVFREAVEVSAGVPLRLFKQRAAWLGFCGVRVVKKI